MKMTRIFPHRTLVIVIIISIIFGLVFVQPLFRKDSKKELVEVSEESSKYKDYTSVSLAQAQEKDKTVLYFWASWCPTCKVLDKELRTRGSELPKDVTVLKVNYDTEIELKKRYQIVTQHTLVQIDQDGNEITKWVGGNIDVIKQQLK